MQMSLPKVNLVVVGHKDHGKSTLIGRLIYDTGAVPREKIEEIKRELEETGQDRFEFAYLLDSLEEERKGGLTIDIMQTPFRTEKHQYTIIDCPGHREFIKNMLTGASQADAAILVVSAVDGVADQTRQHLSLIKMLGIDQVVVVVNKMDAVDYDVNRFNEVSQGIRELLDFLNYREVPIVPISAFAGDNIVKNSENMKWYNGSPLIEALDKRIRPPKPSANKPLRGFVQDLYNLKGIRTVVCKIETGTLKKSKTILFLPSGKKGVLERIETFGEEMREAGPGESVGLIVAGVDNVERGEVISYPENPVKTTRAFTAELITFPRIKLEVGDILKIRCGTTEREGRLEKIMEKMDTITLTVKEFSPETLEDGEVGKVLLRTERPLCLEKYTEIPQLGRFIIAGEKGTIAAGIVLNIENHG